MSRSDYERPANYQIDEVYKCSSCNNEVEGYATRCHCGGEFILVGESYPSNPDDWDECRDDFNSPWHRK